MEQRRDFDLEAQVGEWRRWQQRTSSLSPRELDELEDHLRAHVDLEEELNPGLGPARAFRIACAEIGSGATLAKEFAKAGKVPCRRVFMQGWVLYAASFLLPSSELEFSRGYQFLLGFTLSDLTYPNVLAFAFLPNLVMFMTTPVFLGRKPPSPRCLKWLLGIAGVGALGAAVVHSARFMVGPPNLGLWDPLAAFGIGFWAWTASLIFVAAALQLRAREWASAKPEPRTRVPDRGAYQ